MKTQSFSKHMFTQSVWLSIILFFSFVVILLVLTFQVTEITISSLSKLESKNIANRVNSSSNIVYKKWEDIPMFYKKLFDQEETIAEQTIEKEILKEEKIAYLYTYTNDVGTYSYILSVYNIEDVIQLSDDIFDKTISTIAVSIFIIFILLFFFLKWLIKRSAQPYKNLSIWVDTLPQSATKEIDFSIEEVNNIALQLQEKIAIIQEYSIREKEFLKYTSHELRTPLAIIQASLDTLNEYEHNEQIQKPIKRALKASYNVKLISSALLYLARESTTPLKKSEINTQLFIDNIIKNHTYLLDNKKVEIEAEILVSTLIIEEELFFVLISNLIKNAFQHTQEGTLQIRISQNQFSIVNPLSKENATASKEISFSLGLKLVELIVQKLSFSLKIEKNEGTFLVVLGW